MDERYEGVELIVMHEFLMGRIMSGKIKLGEAALMSDDGREITHQKRSLEEAIDDLSGFERLVGIYINAEG